MCRCVGWDLSIFLGDCVWVQWGSLYGEIEAISLVPTLSAACVSFRYLEIICCVFIDDTKLFFRFLEGAVLFLKVNQTTKPFPNPHDPISFFPIHSSTHPPFSVGLPPTKQFPNIHPPIDLFSHCSSSLFSSSFSSTTISPSSCAIKTSEVEHKNDLPLHMSPAIQMKLDSEGRRKKHELSTSLHPNLSDQITENNVNDIDVSCMLSLKQVLNIINVQLLHYS